MGAEQNIQTVKAIYDAFGRGDVDAILERCTDDVDWAADAAIEVAPWHGIKHGKAELPSFFAGIGQTGPVTEFTPLSFAGNDDGDVMVFLRYAFTVTATGKDVATNLHPTTGDSATGGSRITAAQRTPRSSRRHSATDRTHNRVNWEGGRDHAHRRRRHAPAPTSKTP